MADDIHVFSTDFITWLKQTIDEIDMKPEFKKDIETIVNKIHHHYHEDICAIMYEKESKYMLIKFLFNTYMRIETKPDPFKSVDDNGNIKDVLTYKICCIYPKNGSKYVFESIVSGYHWEDFMMINLRLFSQYSD